MTRNKVKSPERKTTRILLTLSIFIMAIGLSQPAAAESGTDPNFTVELPNIDDPCDVETITIPNGRPIYALLVSGFHQNRNLDMFHYYNFAKYLQERGAYVHYAWWNNLLAPYMEKPLHNINSVPSTGPIPWSELFGVTWGAKAIPNEDYQFQADANSLLTAIRDNNPDAIIILVGHSMGGDSIARLAQRIGGIGDGKLLIDLLAPIDPVGNRSEVPGLWTPFADWVFTRYRATHTDQFFGPVRRDFRSKVTYLYHRWQQEFMPPFDYECPGSLTCLLEGEYYFLHDDTHVTEIGLGSRNVQAMIDTDLFSGKDVPEVGYNIAGGLDGHGEIVGFRGVIPFTSDSYPLALEAEGDWPKWLPGEPNGGPYAQDRIDHLKMWEKDPHYLYKNGFEPWNPGLCMVSRDLCNILDTIIGPPDTPVNQPPVADAGADQTVSVGPDCAAAVTLDGSGSYDEDGDNLTYSWRIDDVQVAIGVNPTIQLSLDVYAIELVVNDGQENSLPDQVVITAVDTTAPVLTCPADVVLECPADTSVEANGSATAIDSCDDSVLIIYADEITPGAGNTETVIRTWTAIDASGNSSSCDQVIIVEDTTAPQFSVSVAPAVLRPSNHKMVSITASIQVSDTCDDSPTVELVSIISNEPDNGIGDGNMSDDIQGADFGTDDRVFSLRAERIGKGLSRIYMVNYRAIDASGNVADATAEVTVLHDSDK